MTQRPPGPASKGGTALVGTASKGEGAYRESLGLHLALKIHLCSSSAVFAPVVCLGTGTAPTKTPVTWNVDPRDHISSCSSVDWEECWEGDWKQWV